MKIDFVKTLEASSPYTPGRIYFEESTSLIKVATANNQYRVFGGVRSADYDESTQTLTIQNGNGDEVYLDMSEYVKQDSIIYNGNAKIFYGTCSSGGSDTAKVVVCEDFTSSELVKGALIFVTFDASNSGAVASLTLNVNSTGAKSIKKQGNKSSTNNLTDAGEIRANSTYLFQYDGTNWVCMTLDYNSTYSALSEADMQAGTATTGKTISAARVKQAVEYWMTQNQADWDSSDNTSTKYIANKPDIPTDASVAAWGYIKTIADASIAALGYTKNTGTLTGVKFNNTNATINGTVAEITATIPTVNNATLSILKNGTSVGTFTANSSTDTSINIQVNELPTPSTVGPMLVSRYNAQSQVTEWAESTNIFDISNAIHLGYGIPLTVHGSYGDTVLATGGILKTNFSDWSWINIQYQENNTTVTKNLQDYLDESIIFPSTSGRIAESYYNSTTQRYEWKASDIYSITSPHSILAQPTGGFSVLKNITDNPRTVYSLGAGGVGGANTTDWSWIKRWSNNVTTTLQDDLNAKQDTLVGSGTGQNIKTVNNNSLVGSGNVSVGTLTGVKFNNVSATINGTVAEITATIPAEVTESTVSGWGFTKNTGTLTSHATHKLTATNNNATSTSGTITFVESLTGTNTATSGDLTITATRKSVTIPAAQVQSDWNATSGMGVILNKPSIPAAANNATITIQKGGTNVDSFTVNASSNKTINIPNELPAVTASDNGKILKVVSGAWAAATPVTVYSGSNTPNNSTGINGDIYIQS